MRKKPESRMLAAAYFLDAIEMFALDKTDEEWGALEQRPFPEFADELLAEFGALCLRGDPFPVSTMKRAMRKRFTASAS